MSQTVHPLEIKSASLDLLALQLRSADLSQIESELDHRFGLRFSDRQEAFVLDLELLAEPAALDLAAVLANCARRGIHIVALRHPDPALADLAHRHHLAYAAAGTQNRNTLQAAETILPEPPAFRQAMVIDKPVRAGQQIYAKDGDLIVLAMVSAGAEVIADGHIHIYAPLRGRALAGARGNTQARIFAHAMEAELLSIAGVYRTLEQALPASIQGKPTQVYLENERLVITAIGE
ncbi:septum site-determining protein MinC [Craterilacuibacter sp.]|uniref:septum site-determining protein MinC n=1 Tax=Craterilacuibacter sp. TaxID=2870909 RepID=UPI003F34E545